MKRGHFLLIFLVITIFSLVPYTVEPLPIPYPREADVYVPKYWYCQETKGCPNGYMCRDGVWVPSFTTTIPMWIFGVTNKYERGGVLNFREYPDYTCRAHCVESIPVLYTADVIYVPYYGGDYLPEDVPITYLPPGEYIVTSPSFAVYYNVKIWFFPDRGGPKKMSAALETDKEKYGKEDTSVIYTLQVTDEDTKEYIQVDKIFGKIVLPDNTEKTVTTEDWAWNEEEELYVYCWDFLNDEGKCSDPKEGSYSCELTAKKKYYEDARAGVDFAVCYHVEIDLEFDKDIPKYSLGEPVEMTVYVTDENGSPVTIGVESVLVLPNGEVKTDLSWTQTEPGTYSTSYTPVQEGVHHITVGVKENIICYLKEASSEFYVKACEEAHVDLEIIGTTINEPVTFVLTVTDGAGNGLSGGEIESGVYLIDNPPVALSWSDLGNGVYEAVYTPSEVGFYTICGTVIIFEETGCFRGFFDGSFIVEEKKLPDLVIRNEDIRVYSESGEDITENSKLPLGETVTISVTVWNIGDASAENFWVVILIDGNLVYKESVVVLAAGESILIECMWAFNHSGCYTISAAADPPEGII
ncbi:MAG: hypothetical protein HXS48_16370 [Theionarchaea archaeon]|nr:hypothetical protein [Theionarchaea archaeon]